MYQRRFPLQWWEAVKNDVNVFPKDILPGTVAFLVREDTAAMNLTCLIFSFAGKYRVEFL